MREGKFIDKNVKRWHQYNEPAQDADALANRFSELIDDLGYAKTFYPKSQTTIYLNAISAKMFQSIYAKEKKKDGKMRKFFKYELPLTFLKYHKHFLFTLIFFMICVAIGVMSAMKDYSFISSILGSDYVDMTEENINRGDPFGVYKDKNAFSMFIRIATNNIQVSFWCIAFGILAGIGTLYILFSNGLMLGSFQYMFFAKGLGWQSILVVWIHGTIEISSIVIASTAGIILGFGFLFPGTFSRLASFKRAGIDAAKISIGLIPLFLLAAFLESYITRLTNMPIFVSILILFFSLLLIVGYFIIYPMILKRNGYRLIDNEIFYPEK